jgi:hypothetical protein
VIAMEDDRFAPNRIEVLVGTTVVWENHGADWHSVEAFDGSFESAQLASGESFSYTFTTPGEYPFICKHHGRQGMIGRIIVTGSRESPAGGRAESGRAGVLPGGQEGRNTAQERMNTANGSMCRVHDGVDVT